MENNNVNTSVENTTPNTEGTGTNQGIESAIEKGKEQKENAILKSYFKQQGYSGCIQKSVACAAL